MALYYGLVDVAHVPAVAEALAESVKASDYCIKTGEIGLRPTLMSLAEHGHNDVHYTESGVSFTLGSGDYTFSFEGSTLSL